MTKDELVKLNMFEALMERYSSDLDILKDLRKRLYAEPDKYNVYVKIIDKTQNWDIATLTADISKVIARNDFDEWVRKLESSLAYFKQKFSEVKVIDIPKVDNAE